MRANLVSGGTGRKRPNRGRADLRALAAVTSRETSSGDSEHGRLDLRRKTLPERVPGEVAFPTDCSVLTGPGRACVVPDSLVLKSGAPPWPLGGLREAAFTDGVAADRWRHLDVVLHTSPPAAPAADRSDGRWASMSLMARWAGRDGSNAPQGDGTAGRCDDRN